MPETKRKYRPSNGTEGEDFMERFCYRCKHDEAAVEDPAEGCPIIVQTMVLDLGDPEYPEQWIYDESGHPVCTEFEVSE